LLKKSLEEGGDRLDLLVIEHLTAQNKLLPIVFVVGHNTTGGQVRLMALGYCGQEGAWQFKASP
jgi:hypothetical protein